MMQLEKADKELIAWINGKAKLTPVNCVAKGR